MKVVKCINNHFFDQDKYPLCPHCGAPAAIPAAKPNNVVQEKPKRGFLSGLVKKNNAPANEPVAPVPVQQPVENNNGKPAWESATEPIDFGNTPNGMGNSGANSHPGTVVNPGMPVNTGATAGRSSIDAATQPMDFNANPSADLSATPGMSSPSGSNNGYPAAAPQNDNFVGANQSVQPGANPGAVPSQANNYSNAATPQGVPAGTANISGKIAAPQDNISLPTESIFSSGITPEPDISSTIKKSLEENEGKTVSFFASMTAASSSSAPVTTSASSGSEDSQHVSQAGADSSVLRQEPVCGWLVCIAGSYIGGAFPVYAGKNSIGRNRNNRIVLDRDNHVSREHHALIIYEPKKRNFYIQPGDSSGLTYLNDEYIMEPKPLSAKDRIEIGQCKFLFVPLCGEDFSWEEYLNKE